MRRKSQNSWQKKWVNPSHKHVPRFKTVLTISTPGWAWPKRHSHRGSYLKIKPSDITRHANHLGLLHALLLATSRFLTSLGRPAKHSLPAIQFYSNSPKRSFYFLSSLQRLCVSRVCP